MKNTIEAREHEGGERLRLVEETESLKETLMWGPVGVEAALAQLLPKDESLFFDEFDVLAARNEFNTMADLFRDEGVKVILVREELQKMLAKSGMVPVSRSIEDLAQAIIDRGLEFRNEYGINRTEVLDLIYPLLVVDAERYGEKEAILLNEIMANLKNEPLANAMFARDQSTVVGDTFIWSNMSRDIRKPEVGVYKYALTDYLREKKCIEVGGDGHLEGGDTIVSGGICYIGVGGRSNLEGISQIAPDILRSGLRLIAVYSEERDLGTKGEMDAMHLDTFWMPFSVDQSVCCVNESEKRIIKEFYVDNSGKISVKNGGSFMDHLTFERNMEILSITKEEQEAYAPNFQNLGNKRVVLPLSTNRRLISEFERAGATVLTAEIFNITRGYGATHCSMAPTIRK